MRELRGTALSGRDFEQGKVLTVEGAPNARYRWDTGIAIGRYLAAMREGMILGIHCPGCKRTMVPPRIFCENCMAPLSEFIELEDTGTVNTFSLCYVTWDVQRLVDPIVPAVIEIDGASRGMGIMHLLGEVKPEEVRIGMRVQAVWRPAHERRGAITDILHFRPLI